MFPWDNLTNAELTRLCRTNSTVNITDPNCSCLILGGGPELNSDVSGPGVRISFYLQALFLALLAARSNSLAEISNALYTLVVTNISMTTTSLILGFKSNPEMSLQDAIVVFYLLSGSWFSILFSLPSYNRFVKSDSMLQVLTIVHSYIMFAVVLAVLATAHTFGNTPRCNSHAVGVFFYHFPALDNGRIAALVCVCLIICVYTAVGFVDYYCFTANSLGDCKRRKQRWKRNSGQKAETMPTPDALQALVVYSRELNDIERWAVDMGTLRQEVPVLRRQNCHDGIDNNLRVQGTSYKKKRRTKEEYYKKQNVTPPKANVQKEHEAYITTVHGQLMIEIFVIIVLWSLFVMNTELLIKWNRFQDSGDSSSQWGFGQILPLFLVLLPFVQLVKIFIKLGLRKRPHRIRKHQRGLSSEDKATKRARRRTGAHGHDHAYEFASHAFPWFFSMPDDASIYLPGGNPSARISLNSVHSSKPGLRGENETGEDNSLGRRSTSTTVESASTALDIPAASR